MADARIDRFFGRTMAESDPEIHAAVRREARRQDRQIELIAPKNYMSRAVREAHDSMLAFTSVEGYPGRRWHAGVVHLDAIERLAIERAQQLFGCRYANVQPHSGTQASQAAFFALLQPGDRVVSMALDAGGHLSHGLRTSMSGAWFDVAFYGVRPDDGLIDYDEAERLVGELRPNKNLVPGDPETPTVTSRLRVGTSAISTRGLRTYEAELVGHLIADVLDTLDKDGADRDAIRDVVRAEVEVLADRFPLYPLETREAVAG